jgi:hypothetical protein
MPVYFNDATDDPITYDSQPVIQGINSYGRASTIPPVLASNLENIELSTAGITKSRRGAWKISNDTYTTIHAIIALRVTTWDYGLMIFADGNVYLHTPTTTGILFAGEYDSSALPHQCSVTEINGAVYFTDGTGDILAVRQTGSEDILVDDDGNSVWDDVSTIVSYDVAVEIADTDSPENTRALTSHMFRLFCATGIDTLHVSHILPEVGGTESSDPGNSDTATGDAFPPLNSIRVGTGSSDAIRAIVPFKDFRIAILKENSIYVIDANPSLTPNQYNVQMVSDKVGCLAEKSAVRVGDDILFLSRDGVRSVGTAFQQDQVATSDPISLPIQDIIEEINWGSATKSCASFWRGRYILAVPTGSSTVPNTVLVYDTNLKQWAGRWSGWQPSMFDIYEPLNDRRRLVWADTTNNNVAYLRDHIDEDSTTENDYADYLGASYTQVPFEILTRGLTFNDPISPKTCDFLEVEFFKSKARANITLIPDGGDEVILDSGQLVDTGTGELRLDFVLPAVLGKPGIVRHNMSLTGTNQGREFQVKITNSSATQITEAGLELDDQRYIALRNVNLGAFIETLEKQV